jgi:hypothetical protein
LGLLPCRGCTKTRPIKERVRNVKRRIITLLVALVIALLPMGAFAQTAVNNSGFQVQNLGTATANITIVYYKTDGTEAGRQSDTIPSSSSKTYFGSTMQVAAGFNGSVVISSDQPVVAITNLVNASLIDSYGGFSGGATALSLPLIQKGNFGIDSWIAVQNAGTADAVVSIAYTPGLSGNAGTEVPTTIKPGAAASFFQKNNASLGTTFVGSAKVTSTNGQPIVAVVNQETTAGNQLLSYGGFTSSGSTTVAAPLVVANNFGQFTGVQIQNVGTAAADVTVTYSANTATSTPAGGSVCGTPTAKVVNITNGSTATVIQAGGSGAAFDNQFATCTYVGSATITSAQPLVVIVNQILGGSGSSYAGVDPAATVPSVSAPLIQANNFGTFSGIQVQNTGGDTTVTVTYGPNAATATPSGGTLCGTPSPKSQAISAGQSFTFIQFGGSGAAFDNQFATCTYVGSAVISAASGGKITAVVNQSVGGLSDALSTYSAFAQ